MLEAFHLCLRFTEYLTEHTKQSNIEHFQPAHEYWFQIKLPLSDTDSVCDKWKKQG